MLLDYLKFSSPSRIINVSSKAHYFGVIKRDDLMGEKSYRPVTAYAQTKLANVLFARELTKRLKGAGVTAISLHPGVVNTEIFRNVTGILNILKTNFICM